ncbi:hypothetical protein LAU_0284 [Lausannevirus]|uniref:Uncharacterized protein n=2 Tax=Lausannevirus TaxID=999883 RepID=A0A0N9PHW5_9VIRU|nr:hypothetical protein LAU_0284 [Lausannevirus]AEA07135.1 hypothetical protein LAU_0284 [Lausannevirus]ALH06953.1 hypothetical protein PMV_255 [Port-miou virus]
MIKEPENMESYNKILSELKFLSKLKKGEKIMVKSMTVQPSDFFSGVYRTFVGETREATLNFVFDLWDEATKLICSSEVSNEQCKILAENLQESKKGIFSLLATYESDRHFCSRLESLVSTTELHIKEKIPQFSLALTKENAGLARTLQAQEAALKNM